MGENILLDHGGHICLTDFGLSKDLARTDEDLTHSFCGTPEYLPPEIVKNLGHGKAVDWWALGILLYELTVGIPPFYMYDLFGSGLHRWRRCLFEQFGELYGVAVRSHR